MDVSVGRLINSLVFSYNQQFVEEFKEEYLTKNWVIILRSIRGAEIAKMDDLTVKENY
jgi:hypothetical protein